MKETTFKSKQIIGEFWISFKGEDGLENGLIVKKLSDNTYLIPSGIKKKIFKLKDFESITPKNDLVQLPFVLGSTDFYSCSSMGIKTFRSFLKAFKKISCLHELSKK